MSDFARANEDPWLSPITDFVGTRQATRPSDRLEAVRRAATVFRERMASGKKVRFFQSLALQKAPYPTRYGLLGVQTVPTPFLHIVNSLFVVQIEHRGAVRTLLLSPTDIDSAKTTPFFARLTKTMGPLAGVGEKVIAPRLATVEERLAELGIAPEAVDYISYDHLHTQDVRKWLGARGREGLFPNARLLVMRQEWESGHGLLPTQADWYCPGGLEGVDPARVILLDGDTMVGESLAILHTPGHTEGNHSFVTHTDRGLVVTSENGIGADAYAPSASRIPGVRALARHTGAEVILNGNTLEGSVDQYISMVMEKTIAGPCPENPDFYNVHTSSEFDGYWAFPGLKPTFRFGDVRSGEPTLAPARDRHPGVEARA